MEIPLLTDILITFALSVVILLACDRFRIPALVGLLLTGVLAGPSGFSLVGVGHQVDVLAEIGIVLLMFTIGIEFSLTKLFQIGRTVLLGGSLQVVLTALAVYAIALCAGLGQGESVFMGFLVSLSSTAIVLKSLQERAEVETPHGRTSLGVLIFQDIAIVPMMLIAPLLAGKSENPGMALLILLGKGVLVMSLVLVGARFVVPWLLFQIARTRSRELFVLSVVVLCFAVAWFTSSLGLSLGLGAFLAGLIISESEYSHQAMGGILPFRDVFTSLFFVSIGMLLDLKFLLREPLLVAGAIVVVFLLKGSIMMIVSWALRLPLRTMILTGFALSQIGEFSFVLAASGLQAGLLDGDLYQLFLAVTVLSMAATPLMLHLGPKVAGMVSRRSNQARQVKAEDTMDDKLQNHLIVIGFGVNGRNVARAARAADIPYIVIETNADTVHREQKKGEKIIFGDASYHAVLEHVCISDAKVVAVVINDPIATRSIIQVARQLNPSAFIIVRTRFVREIGALRALGATEVIPEEFETSVEIFARIMGRYNVPRNDIEKFIADVREDEYEMFRTISVLPFPMRGAPMNMPEVEVSMVKVMPATPLDGVTLAEIDLRKRYGVTLLEIRREGEVLGNPAADMMLHAGDLMVVMGSQQDRDELARLCGVMEPAADIVENGAPDTDANGEAAGGKS